ncbi:major facilitator superfamily domain-containing protein [Pavlovales sp. CCMP2436]|nr:major facilitator superfamily domain-containing protein [Pavlovales sp. CCMP2436]|mmetsp:Transcript_1621/g.4295  ORF Transcript_1621/g.4295 Transcript_1621/m.4295 type:complete len:463 (+) Transcript_1621:50-1438(+)
MATVDSRPRADATRASKDGDVVGPPPPPGGVSRVFAYWVVSAGSLGVSYSNGILLVEFLNEFGQGRAQTAAVGAAATGLMLFGGIFVGPLVAFLDTHTNQRGSLVSCALGAVLAGLGLFVSAEADALWQLFLSYSLLVGLGHTLALYAGIIVVNQWFNKRQALASALGNTGAGVGPFLLAPLWATMRVQLGGWRGILRVLAGCDVVLLLAAAFGLTPPPPQSAAQPSVDAELDKREDAAVGGSDHPKSSTWAMLKNRELMRITLAALMYGMGSWTPFVFLVDVGLDQGLSRGSADVLVLCLAAGSIGLRVPINALADKFGRRKVWVLASLGYALVNFILPFIWTSNPVVLYPYAVLAGGFVGGLNSMIVTLAPPVCPPEQMGQAVGISCATLGLGTFLGPVITGAIFDKLGSYSGGWWFSAACLFPGCLVLWFPIQWFGAKPAHGEKSPSEPAAVAKPAAKV